jgi:hypothetical protein
MHAVPRVRVFDSAVLEEDRNAVDQQADAGVKRDVVDPLPELAEVSPRHRAPFDLEQRPRATSGWRVFHLSERD